MTIPLTLTLTELTDLLYVLAHAIPGSLSQGDRLVQLAQKLRTLKETAA